MIINRTSLLTASPIVGMLKHKARAHGVSHGLAEAGYDITIKQDVRFEPHDLRRCMTIGQRLQGRDLSSVSDGVLWELQAASLGTVTVDGSVALGRFAMATAAEAFDMPDNLVGIVHDKSTWARQGLSVFNTVIEPGWHGELVLELVYHGIEPLHIPAGAGIAQVIFHDIAEPASYAGKYQGQSGITGPIMEQTA